MIGQLLRLLLSFTTLAVCGIGVAQHGPSLWPVAEGAGGVAVGLSVWVVRWHTAGVWLARLIGLLSGAGLALLLAAATMGGSFHLDQAAQFLALGLGAMAVLGLACFAVRTAAPGR